MDHSPSQEAPEGILPLTAHNRHWTKTNSTPQAVACDQNKQITVHLAAKNQPLLVSAVTHSGVCQFTSSSTLVKFLLIWFACLFTACEH